MRLSAIVDPKAADHREHRIPPVQLEGALMARLHVATGETIRITSAAGRSAVLRVGEPLPPGTAGSVRFDRYTRQALRAHPHEEVQVEKVALEPATELVLVSTIPLTAGHLQFLGTALKQMLVEERAPVAAGMLLHARLGAGLPGIVYEVHDVSPAEGLVTANTAVVLEGSAAHEHGPGHGRPHQHLERTGAEFDATFDDIGGLSAQIREVREFVELPLVFPELYHQLGIAPPRGVIFHGAPGTGKTLLARGVANEINARFYYVDGPALVGSYGGETEQNLRNLFAEAARSAPAIIFVDEIDAIAPARGKAGTMADARAVTQLLALMDGLQRAQGVIVIGTTNRLESIDVALRRAGRFDREIYFPTPGPEAREQILRVHTRDMPLVADALEALPEIARRCHGYVGADLMELAREAGLAALRRAAAGFLDSPSRWTYPSAAGLVVTREDFETALRSMHPASLRESLISYPTVSWSDIGGLRQAKERLRELIEAPLLHPETFRELRLPPSAGVLLHGPPGTGKTLLAKAAAHECGVNLIAIQGAEIFSQWVGESEESIRHVFTLARRAAPCIVFFDQLDAIAPRRVDAAASAVTQRVVNQLLAELDGMEGLGQVVVLGATNNLPLVDPSLLRPGRFGVHLHIGPPDETARAEILVICLRDLPLAPSCSAAELIELLVPRTVGCTGADLAHLCYAATLRALQESGYRRGTSVSRRHFEEAVEDLSSLRSNPHPAPLPLREGATGEALPQEAGVADGHFPQVEGLLR